MALLNWKDDLRLGFAEIDRDHQTLIRMINRLEEAIKAKKGNSVISQILDDLIFYTATHFGTEERYFDEFGYPDAELHKKEHAACIEMVEKFANDFNKGLAGGGQELAEELLGFLCIWWKYHIQETDAKYVDLFGKKGLT